MREGITVDELDGPIQNTDQAPKDAEHYGADNITVTGRILLCDRAKLAKAVDDGYQQAAKADTSKAVGKSASKRATSDLCWIVVDVEVPRAIDARDGGMDGVLQPLRDPVRSKRDEHDQADDFALSATANPLAAGCVVWAGLVFDVDGHKSDRVPSGKSCS